jgi:radical SAM protein with 4Fe4S-binding SPASM domain
MFATAFLKRAYRRLRRRPDSWTHFRSILDTASLESGEARSGPEKRWLFKRNVTLVELEPHAYCNRTCSFCPNATIDRLSVRTPIDRGVFDAIIDDLASIDYDRVVRFARYSEPMAHPGIYELIATTRQRLPRAEIDIVTNGDYLNPQALTRLCEVGLSVLRISVYMPRGTAWSPAAARGEIARVGRRIGIAPEWTSATATSVGATFPADRLEIIAFSHNFDEVGYDRGQLVEKLVDSRYVRRSPCFLVFSNFTIDFNGKVMPCCNLRSDHPQHAQFVLGDLSAPASGNIFDVYASRNFAAWRRGLATVSDKEEPCRTCKQKVLGGAELRRLERVVTARLGRTAIGT